MKIIDSKGRIFGKLNIIDLIIVICVAVLALGAVIKFNKTDATMTTDRMIEYTMKVSSIRKASVEALEENYEGLVEIESNRELGDIVDVKSNPARELTQLADGSYKEVELPDRYDLLLTVRVKGTETADNYFASSGKRIINGDTVKFTNKYLETSGIIKSVKVIEE